MSRPTSVEIFYFDAGGGHRAAMNALVDILAERFPDWRVTPVDLQRLLEPIDPVHRITSRLTPPLARVLRPVAPGLSLGPVQSQAVYNTALRSGATYGFGTMLPMLKMFIRHNAPRIEQLLQRRWQAAPAGKPDLVVSVIPNFNGAMFRALRRVHPDVPYVTIMTDMVDCPPRFWMENQDQFLVCGTRKAFEQARKTGFYRPDRVFQVSGMILRKSFHDRPGGVPLRHSDLGLSPDRRTVLIMFGGNGSLVARHIVDQLKDARPAVQAIVMAGKNEALRAQLQGRPGCHAVGFVQNVADYMRLADVFIGKPGPGSISEALHMGCPVIVQCNAATMPQERPNVDWVLENGVGVALKSFRKGAAVAVQRVLGNLGHYTENIRRNVPENRAVFEIAEILGRIRETGEGPAVVRPVVRKAAGSRPKLRVRARVWRRRLLGTRRFL